MGNKTNVEMLTGEYFVSPDQLAHDLAIAKIIKSQGVSPMASGYAYYGAYIKYLREFEAVIENRSLESEGSEYARI